jgi:hypothetical protein
MDGARGHGQDSWVLGWRDWDAVQAEVNHVTARLQSLKVVIVLRGGSKIRGRRNALALSERRRKRDEENPMQDLIQNYVSDLNKLREVFHNELAATSEELSKAMALYAKRSDAALASFVEKASARGMELEASTVARLNQFRGLPANDGLPDVDNGPLTQTPAHSDAARIAASAERAVADSLHVEGDRDRKPQPARSMTLVKSEPAA